MELIVVAAALPFVVLVLVAIGFSTWTVRTGEGKRLPEMNYWTNVMKVTAAR
jgi:hypothetical protein